MEHFFTFKFYFVVFVNTTSQALFFFFKLIPPYASNQPSLLVTYLV